MKNLVVVESPTKAKTISRFLGDGYEIMASMGHIMDLPKSKLSIDIENNFAPDYQQMPDKKKVISQLKAAGESAENIFLATDPDREGEAIAAHVKEVLSKGDKKFARVVFHEITKEAIDEAFKTPRDVDENLVDAQTARRVLDRLVGYKLSPILWSKVRRGLSAGRVQSIALRLIVEREREIEKFKKENYYTISVTLKKGQDNTVFNLIEVNKEKIEISNTINLYDGDYTYTKTSIDSSQKADEIVESLKNKQFTVSDVAKKQARRSPPPPYTTSTLQQDGARRMGLSGRRTMSLAQKLYEEGFITYHRTDSVALSDSARKQMTDYVVSQFGNKYLPEKPRFYKNTQKNAQEAHESIRPTNVSVSPSQVSKDLGNQYGKLYEIIWRRAIATQMADAITESTSVLVDTSQSSYTLKANGSVLVFDGFLKINPWALNDNKLPEFNTGENLDFVSASSEEHETLPPPRYNDASIIKTLEEKGIGRPSTYATIISTIESRQYIERVDQRFQPTNVGVAVNDFLVTNFSTIDDIPFTAQMEDELDDIANGAKQWVPVIREFYTPFEKTLGQVKDSARVKIEVEKTNEICPKDGGHLIIRIGRFGKFMACENFPACKFTKPFVQETDLTCPKDGGKIILKKTKKGRRFYGCSNYPKCDFAAWKLDDIKKGFKEKEKEEKSEEKKPESPEAPQATASE
ncbi:type I DNA topoisomerase [Patescibacteria group bacterium]|nr:type I DNA topoisomerase [Patescibacteria group bacterium]